MTGWIPDVCRHSEYARPSEEVAYDLVAAPVLGAAIAEVPQHLQLIFSIYLIDRARGVEFEHCASGPEATISMQRCQRMRGIICAWCGLKNGELVSLHASDQPEDEIEVADAVPTVCIKDIWLARCQFADEDDPISRYD